MPFHRGVAEASRPYTAMWGTSGRSAGRGGARVSLEVETACSARRGDAVCRGRGWAPHRGGNTRRGEKKRRGRERLVCGAMVRLARAYVLPTIETAMHHIHDRGPFTSGLATSPFGSPFGSPTARTPAILRTTSRLEIGNNTTTHEYVPYSKFPFNCTLLYLLAPPYHRSHQAH